MSIRRHLFHCFLTACGLGLPAIAPAAPNVLFIVIDDLNTSLGCYGNPTVKSPNIDRLAARGTRFEAAYCQYPLCNPSRTSFLSGRRPERTGVYVLNTAARTAMPAAVLLPQFFRERGYFTAGAGKVFHNAKVSDPKSWDFYEDGNGADPQEQAALQDRAGGDGRPAWHVLDGDGSRTRDGLNARTIAAFIREKAAAKKSFFVAAGFHKPHLPWTAPKRFFDLYPDGTIQLPAEPPMRNVPAIAVQTELSGFEQPSTRAAAVRGYYACISSTDAQVGLLLDQLDGLDLWKTTTVVLLGDNGYHLGDHGGLWAKLSAYEVSNHVPLIFAGAGVPAGRVIAGPVELLDVYPTLLELTGFPRQPGLEGKSLVAAMQGAKPAAEPIAFSLVFHYDVAGRRDVLGHTAIASTWRYTEWEGGAMGRELYSAKTDAGEYHNRIDDPALKTIQEAGQTALKTLPAVKPGPANRPRALAPGDQRVN